MKKLIALIILISMCALSACSSSKTVEAAPSVEPSQEAAPQESALPVLDTEPTVMPNASSITYSTLTGDTTGVTMEYPSNWVRVPGTYTICFTEPETSEKLPSKVTFTRKTGKKTITPSIKTAQLASFFTTILKEFDSNEVSTLDKKQSFFGDSEAYSATYTAKLDNISYKGYIVMAVHDKSYYVFHFRCTQAEYDGMYQVMTRIRDSIGVNK